MTYTRRILATIHCDPAFRDLSWDAKSVYLFLMTHLDIAAIGVMRGSVTGLSVEVEEAGLKRRGAAKKAVIELVDRGFIEADPQGACIAIPAFPEHNPPASPNVVIGWGSAIADMPSCPTLTRQMQRALDVCIDMGPPFVQALRRAFPEMEGHQQ